VLQSRGMKSVLEIQTRLLQFFVSQSHCLTINSKGNQQLMFPSFSLSGASPVKENHVTDRVGLSF